MARGVALHLNTEIGVSTTGIAGPTGRPLALATFVPQAYAWPSSPDVFLYANACLHLLNGALVVWLLYLLTAARSVEPRLAAWVASLGGALWMLMPILASSSLLIVQRMTVLSGTFVLIAFVGYLYARRRLDTHPRSALVAMTACVAGGTLLATLAKENGALLPLYVLVAEATILGAPQRVESRRQHAIWKAVFLVLPAVPIVAYLAFTATNVEFVPSG
jgi:hypothetical protein